MFEMVSVTGAGILHTVGMSGAYGDYHSNPNTAHVNNIFGMPYHFNLRSFQYTAVDLPMSVVSVNVRILEPHGDLGQTQPLPRASIPLIVVPFVFFWDMNTA
jgi:hypothetical protein